MIRLLVCTLTIQNTETIRTYLNFHFTALLRSEGKLYALQRSRGHALIDCAGAHTKYLLACCSRFFEDYKKNENKEVKIDEFLNAEESRKAIKESMVSSP